MGGPDTETGRHSESSLPLIRLSGNEDPRPTRRMPDHVLHHHRQSAVLPCVLNEERRSS